MTRSNLTPVPTANADIVCTVTPTVLNNDAYDASDLLFDATEIASACLTPGETVLLQSLTLLDKADQGVAMSLVFANAATDFGTLDSAPDPDDTECETVVGHVAIATTDYLDLGGTKIACLKNIGLLRKCAAGTTSL